MIDTVTLKVPMTHLLPGGTKADHLRYLEAWDRRQNGKFTTWIRNPNAAEIKSKKYLPYLTAHKERETNWSVVVKIQFSVPKMIYGNNVDEVTRADLLPILRILRARLETMGLKPQLSPLLQAQVIGVHYSKNIVLSEHNASEVVNQLGRVATVGRNQSRNVAYQNFGMSLTMFNQQHGFIIYDKTAEVYAHMTTSERREARLPEILRLEVRLENKRKINQLFMKLGIIPDPSFHRIYDAAVSKQVIMDYWDLHINNQMRVVSADSRTPIQLFELILRRNPGMQPHAALKLTALVICAQSPGGLNVLRAILHRKQNDRSWARIKKQINEVNEMLSQPANHWEQEVTTQLTAFEAVKLIKN